MENAQPKVKSEETGFKKFLNGCKKVLIKIKNGLKYLWQELVVFPCHIITHPIQGWTEFKTEKRGKMGIAILMLAIYIVMKMVEYKYLGPVINENNPYKFNSIKILVYGVLPPILLAVGNWSVTTLMDGKGKMGEIFKMICYSLFPITVAGFFNIALSNVITIEEAQFVTLFKILGWAITGFMVFMGLVTIHEYGIGKTIWSIILTIVACLIICFIALLLFNLAEQVYGFVYTVYKEISTRYL